jgi:ribonuclease HI
MRVVAMFDGGCLNGVRAAGAAVVYDLEGSELGRRAHYMDGSSCTVNVAEYCGLITALELARDLGATHVRVLGDSELIVRQFTGRYQVRKEHLKPWRAAAIKVSKIFDEVRVEEFPRGGKDNRRRHGNSEADAYATACMAARRDLP